MDVKTFYEVIGESFEDVLSRLRKEDRIAKYVRMFVADGSFADTVQGFESSDCEKAFRGAHTMKGTASNMGFTKLAKTASDLTEDLRPGAFTDKSRALLDALKVEYDAVIAAAKNLD